MVGYMNLKEQVDKDFSRARRRALHRHIGARLRRRDAASHRLQCFDDLRKISGAVGSIYRGMRTVPVAQIGGSVGRCSEFDTDFMPTKASVKERWKHIDRAFHRGEELPPVNLYRVGSFYFVLDGHHRVSVARFHGVEWIDAEVMEFRARLSSDRRGKGGPIEPSEGGESKVHGMMDLQLVNQRREEMMREAERNRLVKALRDSRKGRDTGRTSSAAWELKRIAGRLLKFLRTLELVLRGKGLR
jgi:hypothetical protein